jgi:hypothetical protein
MWDWFHVQQDRQRGREKKNTEQFNYLWLWTLLAAIKLPRPVPRTVNIHLAISTFSTPLSARTLDVKKIVFFVNMKTITDIWPFNQKQQMSFSGYVNTAQKAEHQTGIVVVHWVKGSMQYAYKIIYLSYLKIHLYRQRYNVVSWKKSIGIKSKLFNLLTCFIIYLLPVDDEQLQFHTSLKMCQRISRNKKV